MIVADTSVWIDYFNGVEAPHTRMLDFDLQHSRIVTGNLIIVELLQGFKTDKDFLAAKRILACLEYRDMAGTEVAIEAAANYRKLRKRGITVRKTVDMLIATFCIRNNMALIHNDRDFDALEEHLKLKVRRFPSAT